MAENLTFQISLGGKDQVVGSLRDVKKAIKEAEFEALKLSEQFGEADPRVLKLRKDIGALKDTIQDSADATNNFAKGAGAFPAISKSVQGIAAGFAAAQGAIGLFGGESKELEKQLLKVQSALALSQGITGILEAKDSFIALSGIIRGTVIGALTKLRTAITATGIGALAIALALIVGYFDDIKKVVGNIIPSFSKFAENIGKIVDRITDFIGVTSEASREIQKTIADNEKAIKRTETFLKLNADKYDEFTQRKIKANLEYKQNLNDILKDETLTTEQRDALRKQAADKYNRDLKKADEDRAKAEKEVTDKRNEEAEKARQKEADRIAALDKKAEENKIRLININNQEKEDKKKAAEDQKKEDEKEAEKQNKNVESIVARAKATVAGIVAQNDYLRKQDEDNAKAKVEAEKAKQNAIALTAQAIGGLSEVVGRDTAAGKIFASAQALINTYLGATQVLSDKTLPTVAKIAGVASVLASGFVAVRNINKVQVPGQSSGGLNNPQSAGLSPFVPQSASPTQTITQLNQASINAIGNQAIRAYVVESDVSSSQKRIEAIKQKAKFG